MDLFAELQLCSVLIIELTLYFSTTQIVRRRKQFGNSTFLFLWTALALHTGQRRLSLSLADQSIFFPPTLLIGYHESDQAEEDFYWPHHASSPHPLSNAPSTLNVTNAIRLHNHLVDLALVDLPHARQHISKNYFLHSSNSSPRINASSIRAGLSAPLIEFLEGIYVWDASRFSLTPTLRSPPFPDLLSPDPNDDFGSLWYEQFPYGVLLYASGDMSSDDRGLVFDQWTNLVKFYAYPDLDTGDQGKGWVGLEEMLELLVHEVEEGRVVVSEVAKGTAGLQGSEDKGARLWYEEVWERRQWIDKDVDRAVGMWDAYLALVGMRTGRALEDRGRLVTTQELEDVEAGSWASALLPRLRRPGFEFVAPGLRMQGKSSLLRTSRFDRVRRRRKRNAWEDHGNPVTLLFFGDTMISDVSVGERDVQHVSPHYRDNVILDDSCGVYLENANEDSVALLLPHTRDGVTEMRFGGTPQVVDARLLNGTEEQLRASTHGWQGMRFHHMIARWADLVLDGTWTVGSDGVEGYLEDCWMMNGLGIAPGLSS
ncbi:proteinral negative regulator of transcription subunit 3 [Sphaceloma murrayae]|uniref:Proteinral negative regulator of transcription subunit 3 n=1 Tax=Sphaceloma murrayae TaxID=2082308 RepID=A0A2K1R3B8_9PEZI|nr:proteinral negative regulator of transcription subunit 3 [Sphaceloma murrayae]